MKKQILIAALSAVALFSHAQVNMPAPSSTQTIIQDFGLGKIELTYSRPSIKGRTLFAVKSELAPLGTMWRTGANSATRLTFSDFVNIGGKDLDSGVYVLYTIPGKTEWEIIINKGIENWGIVGYNQSQDIVRLKVPVQQSSPPMETFTMQFGNIKPESCVLNLRWGTTLISIPVTTKIQDRLRAQLEAALLTDKKPYDEAANFYFEWDKNYPKALENVNKAIEAEKDAFWLYYLKAKIQKESGDKASAKQSAAKCVALAAAAKNDEFIDFGNELIKSL